MGSHVKEMLAFACQSMLRPIVKILLRSGMTYREFDAHAKTVFVDVCASEFGIRGRPANASRISIMTGLSRRDVQRLKKVPRNTISEKVQGIDRASRVLAAWHDDPVFASRSGVPRALHEDSQSPSFSELFAHYGGDVPWTAMLKELIRSGAVEKTADDMLHVRHRYYMPARTEDGLIERAATVIADVGRTVNYNLWRAPQAQSYFEGRATNLAVPESAVPEFQEYLEERAEALLDNADQWLSEREQKNTDDKGVRLGVGLYLIKGG